MNKFKWMPILRTGTFEDKNKKVVTVDEAALDKIVNNTDVSKVNFVIEHPKFDELGFGGIEKIQRAGNYLFALPKRVEENFKQAVNIGKLPGRSVTLDKNNFSLRNISFLPPNIPPAVSGLGEYSFQEFQEQDQVQVKMQLTIPGVESHFADLDTSDFEFAQYEVSKYPFRTIRDVLRNVKNFFIEKFSLDDAEKIIPEYYLTEIGNPPRIIEVTPPEVSQTSFSKNINGDNIMNGQTFELSKFDLSKIDPNLKAAIEGLDTTVNELQTKLQEKDVELQSATTKLTTAETAQLKNEVLQFCASDDVKLKVTPAIKDKVVNFLMAQKEKDVIEFSSADNTTVKISPFEFAKELVKMLPDSISAVEFATKDNAGEQTPDYLKTAKAIADSVNR